MRLTLRTLLAYRDEALSCVDASNIERQLSGSRTAQAMLRRLERWQQTPKSDPSCEMDQIDANSVANYLNGSLSPESTVAFEESCFATRELLAEVSDCHHALMTVAPDNGKVPVRLRDFVLRHSRAEMNRELLPVEEPEQPAELKPTEIETSKVAQRDWFESLYRPAVSLAVATIINLAILLLLCFLFVNHVEPEKPIHMQVSWTPEQPVTPDVRVVSAPVESSVDDTVAQQEQPTTETDAAEAEPVDEEVHLFELPGGLDSDVEEMAEGEAVAADAGSGGAASGGGGGGALRGPGKPVDFFGVEAKASRIAYVVDASHSMQIDKKYRRARTELIYSIRKLDPSQSFVVIYFSKGMRGAFPSDGLSPANNDNFRELETWSRKVNPRGGTNPWTALQKALAMDVDVVFFLTDGVIPASTTMIGPSASRSHTTIHTVGFKTRKGELLLQQIAADSGGVYRFVE